MSNLSTKIAESVTFEGDQMVIKKTHNADHMLNDARRARDRVDHKFAGDYKLVGHVDMALVNIWLKEAGVAWEDTPAVKEIIRRKMMSNEFQKLRVWEGAY